VLRTNVDALASNDLPRPTHDGRRPAAAARLLEGHLVQLRRTVIVVGQRLASGLLMLRPRPLVRAWQLFARPHGRLLATPASLRPRPLVRVVGPPTRSRSSRAPAHIGASATGSSAHVEAPPVTAAAHVGASAFEPPAHVGASAGVSARHARARGTTSPAHVGPRPATRAAHIGAPASGSVGHARARLATSPAHIGASAFESPALVGTCRTSARRQHEAAAHIDVPAQCPDRASFLGGDRFKGRSHRLGPRGGACSSAEARRYSWTGDGAFKRSGPGQAEVARAKTGANGRHGLSL